MYTACFIPYQGEGKIERKKWYENEQWGWFREGTTPPKGWLQECGEKPQQRVCIEYCGGRHRVCGQCQSQGKLQRRTNIWTRLWERRTDWVGQECSRHVWEAKVESAWPPGGMGQACRSYGSLAGKNWLSCQLLQNNECIIINGKVIPRMMSISSI